MIDFIEVLDKNLNRAIINTRNIVRVGECKDGCTILVNAGNITFTIITGELLTCFRDRLFSGNKRISGADMGLWRTAKYGGRR